MKLLTGGKDISELVEKITWSGDTKQISRKINFTIVKNSRDSTIPKVEISEGDEVLMQDDRGKNIFGGIIFDIDKSASSNTVSYLAYDLMFYVYNSDISKVFDGTPESITREICADFSIDCGNIAETGVHVYMPCLGKKAYEAIMMAYTAAARQNGKKYMPLMQEVNKVSVIEKGTQCGVIMSSDYNLTEASYKSSIQNLVNKVLITDEKGNVIRAVEDIDSQNKYGVIQRVYKQEEGKNADTEARNLFKGAEQSASVSGVPNDFRAVSGYSLIVQESDTGLYGAFYIESDTHTFSNGKAEMQLTLSFENVMDEKEIEKTEEGA